MSKSLQYQFPFITIFTKINNQPFPSYLRTGYYLINYYEINELCNQWYMETTDYLNYLQWLPNELLDDIIELIAKIYVDKQISLSDTIKPFDKTFVTFGWEYNNPSLRDRLLKIKNLSSHKPDSYFFDKLIDYSCCHCTLTFEILARPGTVNVCCPQCYKYT